MTTSSTAPGPHGSGGVRPEPGDRIKPKKPAKVQFASTILVLEALVVLFATLAAYGLRAVPQLWPAGHVPTATTVWTAGGVLVAVLILLSRLVSVPGGYLAGTLVQAPVLASGFLISMMWVVGGIFVVLWFVGLRLGGRIDRERAEYDAGHPETAPNA